MIKVEHLYFQYDDKKEVIRDLSFSIPKGSWVSILGHNGSGKSTLAKLLVGLVKAQQGKIIIDGIELNENTVYDVRKKIGIVFQNPDNQFVGVTVKHDIAFGLENQQVPREEMIERINRYAEMVGMSEFLGKEPQNLSGGQKQRVAIAGALAMHKDLIIFDEATSMLDPEGVIEVTNLIQKLNREYNQTIITITHDLDFALKSDYAIILKEGEIVGEGKPQELFLHEDILKSSKLNIPFSLRLYIDVMNDDSIENKDELVEAIWAYSSNK